MSPAAAAAHKWLEASSYLYHNNYDNQYMSLWREQGLMETSTRLGYSNLTIALLDTPVASVAT